MRNTLRQRVNSNNLAELLDYLKRKHQERFWGIIHVKFKDGVPFLIEEIKQIKLGDS